MDVIISIVSLEYKSIRKIYTLDEVDGYGFGLMSQPRHLLGLLR